MTGKRGMDAFTIGFIFMTLVTAAGAAYVWGPSWLRDRRDARLLREGLPATARVIAVEDTGNRFNSVPEMRIRLEVTAPGRAPYMAETRRIGVSFPTGSVLDVRIDPVRPDHVAIAR
jgi:hypothetical protein